MNNSKKCSKSVQLTVLSDIHMTVQMAVRDLKRNTYTTEKTKHKQLQQL